jgi:leucyl-tRNA synthetase
MVVHETYRRPDGGYASPAEIKIETVNGERHVTLSKTGEKIDVGPIEKMSKSKRNTVDPDDILSTYGADTARWFMLSDSPPDRDVIWTEEGVQGATRFVQRLWRLTNEIAELAAPSGAARPAQFSEAALGVRKAAHGALASVSEDIERLRFNRAIAQVYQVTNTLTDAAAKAKDAGKKIADDLAYAFREAGEIVVRLTAPMMPHLAEECWAALGHKSLAAEQAWPVLEKALLVEETITLPVQVNGKKRADVTVPRNAGNSEVEAAVLALEPVQRALEGKAPKRVIVVPQRIVNVVS